MKYSVYNSEDNDIDDDNDVQDTTTIVGSKNTSTTKILNNQSSEQPIGVSCDRLGSYTVN